MWLSWEVEGAKARMSRLWEPEQVRVESPVLVIASPPKLSALLMLGFYIPFPVELQENSFSKKMSLELDTSSVTAPRQGLQQTANNPSQRILTHSVV